MPKINSFNQRGGGTLDPNQGPAPFKRMGLALGHVLSRKTVFSVFLWGGTALFQGDPRLLYNCYDDNW